MLEEKYRRQVRSGRLLNELNHNPGWVEVILPKMNVELELANKAIFDKRVRKEDTTREKIAYYLGIRRFADLLAQIKKDENNALSYLKEKDLKI